MAKLNRTYIFIFYLLLILVVKLLPHAANAQSHYSFTENKGQWNEEVAYRCQLEMGNLWITDQALVYDFRDFSEIQNAHYNPVYADSLDAARSPRVYGHIYRVGFEGAETEVNFTREKRKASYTNYFLGNDPSKWSRFVRSYEEIKAQNIYPGIDLKFYSNDFFLKYDFVVKPNADASAIALKYDGQDDIRLENGRLLIYTSVNDIIEQKPVAWQIINGEKIYIPCKYKLKNNILKYTFPKGYNKAYELIIDPELIFSTYSGSMANNFGYTAAFDENGNLYAASSVFGVGYPTTLGAYDIEYSGGVGGTDIGISKYDASGSFLHYSTYVGGTGDELPHSIIVKDDELYMLGSTSSGDFPTSSNALQLNFGGGQPFAPGGVGVNFTLGSDIVVLRLNALGTDLLGSTYLGGSDNDGINSSLDLKRNYADEMRGDIDVLENGDVVIASMTFSDDVANLSVSASMNTGLNALYARLNGTLSELLYGGTYGGSNDDAFYSLEIASDGGIILGGGTSSLDFPTTPGVLQSNFGGGSADALMLKLNADDETVQFATYYGGQEYDQAYFIELDAADNPHIFGQSLSGAEMQLNAQFSVPGSAMLLSKFTPDFGAVSWSTLFGNDSDAPAISPTAFLVDLCNNIYLSGWGGTTNAANGGSTNDLPITLDAFQSETDGSDFYMMVVDSDASELVYGSYFGGDGISEHVDGGTSRFDRKGIIYQSVCASCGSDTASFPVFPAGSVVSATDNSTGGCNNGLFKFSFEQNVTVADFNIPPLLCQGDMLQLENTSLNGLDFQWDFGPLGTSTSENPVLTFDETGEFEITLIANSDISCNLSDTITYTISVGLDGILDLPEQSICAGETVQIGTETLNPDWTYTWQPANGLMVDDQPLVSVNPTESTNYVLVVTRDICMDTLMQTVAVTDLQVEITQDTVLCNFGEVLELSASANLPEATFLWSSSVEFLDQLNDNPQDETIEVSPTSPEDFWVQIEAGPCISINAVNINVLALAVQLGDDIILCEADTLALSVLSPSEDVQYFWEPEPIIVDGQNTPSIDVVLSESTLVSVFGTLSENCVVEDQILITPGGLFDMEATATASPAAILSGAESILEAQPEGFSYTWLASEPTTILPSEDQFTTVLPTNTTTFYLEIQDGLCTRSDSVVVSVFDDICGPPNIFVPNAFSPNGDGNNDQLIVRGINLEKLYFAVYNRWGQLIFETNDKNIGWDGVFEGKILDPAVYAYYIEATCAGGNTYFEEGNITLLR